MTLKELDLTHDFTVRQLRVMAGFNRQTDLAEAIDLSKATIHNIEAGKSRGHPASIDKMAKAFDVKRQVVLRAIMNTPRAEKTNGQGED